MIPVSKVSAAKQKDLRLVKDTKLISDGGIIMPILSGLTAAILIFLVVAFFKGWTFNFYANILFGFYALTKRIWISVILLGVIQTLIMIPFRMIRVLQSQNINRFQEKISEINQGSQQIAKVKKTLRRGNLTFLFYLVDFMVQLTLFISIGRLFLTDFYATKLNPEALLSFIPYPDYPLQGLIFKLPYPFITRSQDLGWGAVLGVWTLILLGHIFFYIFEHLNQRMAARRLRQDKVAAQTEVEVQETVAKEKQEVSSEKKSFFGGESDAKQVLSYLGGSTVVLFVVSYLLVRHWPLAITVKIFQGNVSVPNRTLNTVTAIVTFLTFFWFGLQNLLRKGKLAHKSGITSDIIEVTQKEMFRTTLFNSVLTGLGAYFITNLIPSAFELSIFTFELIAILSPLTLDKFVLKLKGD